MPRLAVLAPDVDMADASALDTLDDTGDDVLGFAHCSVPSGSVAWAARGHRMLIVMNYLTHAKYFLTGVSSRDQTGRREEEASAKK